MKTSLHLRKLCLAAVLTAVCVATSTFSIPVGASRCFPIQHLCNILAGVFLGPWYSVGMAFCASLLRNLMGSGTLLAFPGSMAGALLGGILYQYCGHKLVLAYDHRCFPGQKKKKDRHTESSTQPVCQKIMI